MSTPQLLMIEDDARLAQMVGEYLTQSGFGFTHAADGASGLEQLQQRTPDLVILDLMLPDTTAWRCAAASVRCRMASPRCRC